MGKKKDVDETTISVKNYLRYHYVLLQIFGIWIDEPKIFSVKRMLYNIYAITIMMLFFILYPISEIIYLYKKFTDIYDSAFQLTYLLSHILGFCKMGLIFIFRDDIDKYRIFLQSGVFAPDVKRGGPIELKYVKGAIKSNYRQATFFLSFLCPMVLMYFFNQIFNQGIGIEEYFDPILNETNTREIRLKPYKTWFPIESNETPYYELMCLYQVSANMSYGFTIGASDALICGILCHIKAQLLILINSLKTYMNRMEILMREDGLTDNLDKYREFNTNFKNGIEQVELYPKHIQKYADRCFRDCVNHHQQIIELANGTEETFNYLMLIQFGGSLLLICFQLFQLSVSEISSFDSISMIVYLVLAMYQVFIFCWHGNEIFLISDSLPQMVYESNWLVTSLSTRKSLAIMMTRAYRPIKLTAGKFAFLSLETFVTIIRGAGSYFMVLRNMNEEMAQ
ncbi:odorant receptor 4-like [Onthophagus taurus]|uniref:odorant receptor 4-like n=1 Tax=Onthophagus taurus TaxID=166361 RepID=UPI000C20D15C|nr:odorant receptor 4-like [Onthophagus taurus]